MCDRTTSVMEPGEVVHIVGTGTFNGMQAHYLTDLPGARVQVQVTIFGRPIVVELDAAEITLNLASERAYLATCHAPSLIHHLDRETPGEMARRVRLFRCAMLRLVWEEVPPALRPLVETAEWLADRPSRRTVRDVARRQIEGWRDEMLGPEEEYDSVVANLLAAFDDDDSLWDAWAMTRLLGLPPGVCLAQLLRDIFGNPFRPPRIDAAWLAWQSGAVRRLADDIYEQRRFDELPVLGDALEEAGCDDDALLSHCRSSPHFRGCWVLDALLGRS